MKKQISFINAHPLTSPVKRPSRMGSPGHTPENRKVLKIIILLAHPDDETFIEQFIRLAVRSGHDVELVSMTKGEYGTLDPNLKGEKIGKIRVMELQKAAELYGLSKDKVKFLGLIDGHVSVQNALKALRKYFQDRKPEVIIAPEYTLTLYFHSDHMNTGHAVCSLLKNEFITPRPRLFTFHSFKNDIFIRSSMHTKAFHAHQSQIQVVGYLFPLFWLFKLMNGFFYCRRFMFMEALRTIHFNKKIKITFLDRFFYALYSIGKLVFKAWTPEEAPK